MSTQLEALGIELIEGFEAGAARARARRRRRRQRHDARQPGDRGDARARHALHVGPAVAGARGAAGPLGAGRRRHARQDHDLVACWPGSSRTPASRPGFLIGGVPANFGAAARGSASGRRSSSSRPTSTTPRSSTSAPSSCTTGRAPRSSTTSNTTTPTSFPTSPRSSASSTIWCAPCRGSGRIVWNAADARARARCSRWAAGRRCEGFARGAGAGCAVDARTGRRTRPTTRASTCSRAARRAARCEWPLIGAHNMENALAAIAAARHAGVSRAAGASRRCAAFEGVTRRMELRGEVARRRASTTTSRTIRRRSPRPLDGLRRRVGSARILAVLEPRSNTMKHGRAPGHARAVARRRRRGVAVRAADLGWDAGAGAGAARRARPRQRTTSTRSARELARAARSGDHVLIMSNGGFGGLHDKLLAELRRPA